MREHCILFKYPLGLGSTLMYVNYSNSITSGELTESHSPHDTCCCPRRTEATTDIAVFAQKMSLCLSKAAYKQTLPFLPSFPPATLTWHWLPFSSISYGRHADSGKRGLLKMQFELNKLIIHHGSGGGEREAFSCLIKTSEAHSGRTSLICTKSWDWLD